MEPLMSATPPEWAMAVLANFEAFLQDHAACEKKAMATALSLIARFPDKEMLIEPMICLAKEELAHFHEVFRLIRRRGAILAPPQEDLYVKKMAALIRHPEEEFFLDKLLICSLIEARSSERFQVLALHINEPELQVFYDRLAKSERGHWRIFHNIARAYYGDEVVAERFASLCQAESTCHLGTPIRAAVH